ncbi:MAG: type III pantothenate kinase [Muribaculaceae bacterium]|nr:type III pantothenate kinase [Muribaculaceae bacterium]
MKYSLTIDCGNSSTKMAVWAGDRVVDSIVMASPSIGEVESFIGRHDIDAAITGTVVGDIRAINRVLRLRNIPMAKVDCGLELPIVIEYETPETLGADRIAAAVGAYEIARRDGLTERYSDILIADIGTAATYDRISCDGKFKGGNIAPGLGMRLQALNKFTAALPKIESRGETPLWGKTTETAMRAGAFNGIVAEIIYHHSLLGTPAVFLTGGWAETLAQSLPFEARIEPDLVSYGLKIVLDKLLVDSVADIHK